MEVEDFKVFDGKTPVILSGAIDHWPAVNWTLEVLQHIAREIGDFKSDRFALQTVGGIENAFNSTLSEFLEILPQSQH